MAEVILGSTDASPLITSEGAILEATDEAVDYEAKYNLLKIDFDQLKSEFESIKAELTVYKRKDLINQIKLIDNLIDDAFLNIFTYEQLITFNDILMRVDK